MSRISLGVLLCLSSTAVLAQTNCQVMAGGLIQCSNPQTLTSPTPSTTNCTYDNGMMRCTQPQGMPLVQPSVTYPPTTIAPLPAVPNYLEQQKEDLERSREQTDMARERLELEMQRDRQTPSTAQPDDTTLKAAYCTGVIKAFTDGIIPGYNRLTNSLSQLKGNDSQTVNARENMQKSAQITEQMLNEQEAKFQKLKAYWAVRMQGVDPQPVLASIKQGEADWLNISRETEGCTKPCEEQLTNNQNVHQNVQCTMQCNASSEAYQHTVKCQKLDFLPY